MGLSIGNTGSGREVLGTGLEDPALRWQKVKNLFGDALEQDPAGRETFLDQACNGDEALRAEVESLLAAAQAATDQAEPGPKPDRMLGRRLGAYQIVESIASGGMATVYLAHRADDHYLKRVAIKLIHPVLANDALCRRFRSERQTLAALDHPNIVKLLDGGTTEEGLPYLVMDYVDGQPIDTYCDKHQVTVEERLKLFRAVCGAVEHAHQNRIIHRDLKPSNILVTDDGSPKLLDFGIAKLLISEVSPEIGLMTTAGIHHMTPAYASPEQARGAAITYASDVYSLGVVLYELLTGHRPYRFKSYTPSEVERVICGTEAERPSTKVTRAESDNGPEDSSHVLTPDGVSRARGVPVEKLRRLLKGDLDNIVLKALHKDPERRYGSVREFSEDIARHLEDNPVQARPNSLHYRTRKLIRRRKTEMVALALLLVLAAGWAYSLWRQGWRLPLIPAAHVTSSAGGQVKATPPEQDKLKSARPVNPKALDAYVEAQSASPKARDDLLQGKYHVSNPYALMLMKSGGLKKSSEEFALGISYLERAIQEDPNYVPAYLALASAIVQEIPHPNLAPKAIQALLKAEALDENNAEAHLLIARSMGVTWSTYGDPEDEYKKTIQLRSEWAEAHECYAGWLDNVGRFEDGMKEHQKAQALDPKGDYLSGSPLVPVAERLERTRKFMLTSAPGPSDYWFRGEMEYEVGQYAEALKDWVGPVREFGWNQEADAWERAYATGGHQALIQEVMRTLDEIAKHRWWPRDILIDIHRYAGDREGALTWLETAARECDHTFQQVCDQPVLATLRSDRRWDPYRSDPRFQTIARSLNLAH